MGVLELWNLIASSLFAQRLAIDSALRKPSLVNLGPMVFRLISRFFSYPAKTWKDLAQDVFLKVFARIDQVRPDENFSRVAGAG